MFLWIDLNSKLLCLSMCSIYFKIMQNFHFPSNSVYCPKEFHRAIVFSISTRYSSYIQITMNTAEFNSKQWHAFTFFWQLGTLYERAWHCNVFLEKLGACLDISHFSHPFYLYDKHDQLLSVSRVFIAWRIHVVATRKLRCGIIRSLFYLLNRQS